VLAAYYGFYRWQGYGAPTDWVGLKNYKVIFTDPPSSRCSSTTASSSCCPSSSRGPLALVLALLLNQNIRGRGLIRVLIFVPYVISEVIAAPASA